MWGHANSTSSIALPISSGFSTIVVSTKSASTQTTVGYSLKNGTATSAVSSPTASGSLCGEYGNFTLTWDDTPSFHPTKNDSFIAPPVLNPYHHLFYANGYAYVAPGFEPYPPASAPNVVMFFPSTSPLPNEPLAGDVLPGEIGAGPRAPVNAYWFDVYSTFLGCDDEGPTDCTIQATGYRYDAATGKEVIAAQENSTIPTCPGFKDCHLTPVTFSDQFRNLSGIQFEAFINGTGPRIFMMDSLAMGWVNNTCSAGILRIGNRK
ncbi:hypothetical protein K432DRAFT_346567 [Lepidopterella palustris CBS 459.81]|uniref:DUF7371 domain-containing protein n=1 Tax=Lepidopterella palustris CBS 459.81 TaxID=1314670 RepID=A0A8E2EGT4_9PEZI|nr:hypothetical protein K432DRAFT_346567 [Lepidopterella palustris CBS 459.81]